MNYWKLAWLWIGLLGSAQASARVPLANLKPLANKQAEFKDTALLYFWATWCPDCRDKLAGPLVNLANEFPLASLITLNMDRDALKGENYAREQKLSVPVYRDESKSLAKDLGLFSVPAWAVVRRDPSGNYQVVRASSGSNLDDIRKALRE